jgi:hypothetical protein
VTYSCKCGSAVEIPQEKNWIYLNGAECFCAEPSYTCAQCAEKQQQQSIAAAMANVDHARIRAFVDAASLNLKAHNKDEGDYCVLLWAYHSFGRTAKAHYRNLKQFQELAPRAIIEIDEMCSIDFETVFFEQ